MSESALDLEVFKERLAAGFTVFDYRELAKLVAECERLTRRNAELTASEERMASKLRVAEAEVKWAWSEHKKVKEEAERLCERLQQHEPDPNGHRF